MTDNNIIKNFFAFLQTKEQRNIPKGIKLEYFRDELTEKEIQELPFIYKFKHFKDRITDEDMNKLFYSNYIDDQMNRRRYFNMIQNNLIFLYVKPFGNPEKIPDFPNDIAFAGTHTISFFIDKHGQPNVNGINKQNLKSPLHIQAYNNTLRYIDIHLKSVNITQNISLNWEPTNADEPYHFDAVFVDQNNKPADVRSLKLQDVLDVIPYKQKLPIVRAGFLNALIKQKKFRAVEEPDSTGRALAIYRDGTKKYIKLGQILPKGHGYPNI